MPNLGKKLSVLGLAVFSLAGCRVFSRSPEKDLKSRILKTRQWGAHGLGYGRKSIQEMRRTIRKEDIPGLLGLWTRRDGDVRIGAAFALGSLCGESVAPMVQ